MNKLKAAYRLFREKTSKYDTIVKVFISLLILYLIFTKVDISGVGEMLVGLSLTTLLILLLIGVGKFFAQAFFWKFCLEVTSPEVYDDENSATPKIESRGEGYTFLKSHTIGLALRFLLPGGAATFGKIIYHSPEKRKDTFYAILIEKFYMVWIIWFMALWSVVILPIEMARLVKITLVLVGIIISLLPFILPIVFRRHIKYEYLECYFIKVPKLILIQVAYTILTFLSYYIILQGYITLNNSFIFVAMATALVLVPGTIPITFSGLGLREMTAAILLPKLLGVPIEIAVGASLLDFIINGVLPAVPGVVLILTNKKREKLEVRSEKL